MDLDEGPRTRVMDHTARDARHAVADVNERVGAWRSLVAKLYARAQRPLTRAEHDQALEECAKIEAEVLEARTTVLARLIDAPTKVTANSRITDFEKGLDNLEDALAACRKAISAALDRKGTQG